MNKNMPDDEDVALQPRDSKCWTCKHGMVLKDREIQTFVQPGTVPGNSFTEEPEQPGLSSISIDMNKVRSVCFWRSAATQGMISPLVFNVVTECSRYEQRD